MPSAVPASSPVPKNTKDSRASRILARTIFRDMRQSGYECQQILALATELIELVTKDMRGECEADLMPDGARPKKADSLRRVG